MAQTRKRLILDTSAVNALADDSDLDATVRSIRVSFFGVLTETVLAEVITHDDETDRPKLLLMLDR